MYRNVFLEVDVSDYHLEACVVTSTPTERPYIDLLAPDFVLTTGGNGYAAKSADEIGRLAAGMALGFKWDSVVRKDDLKCRFLDNCKL